MRQSFPSGHRGLAHLSAHCVAGWGVGLHQPLVTGTVEVPFRPGFLVQKVSHLLSSSDFSEAGDRGGSCFRDGDSHYPRGDVPQGATGRVQAGAGIWPGLSGQSYQVHTSRGHCPQGMLLEAMPLGLCSLLQTVTEFPGPGTRSSLSLSHPFLSFPFLFLARSPLGF